MDVRQFLQKVFPDHSITEKLREDAESTLFRGRRLSDGRAILFLTSAADHPTSGWFARLEAEHSLLEDLELPWAARPLALVRAESRMVLLLEDPDGTPLDALRGRRFTVAESLRFALGIAACLSRVHGKGLLHKDIKPANILVDLTTGAAALTGFGLAATYRRERELPGPPETLAGTLAYIAPEQTGRMDRPVDARSDLYSLGVVLYEALTGTLPFTASDPSELLHSHLARQPVAPAEVDRMLPVAVSDLVMKLLSKPPEERYQTALGAEADLRRCLDEWEAQGRIEPFPLAERDVPDRPLPLEKLYGREAEAAALRAAWERVAGGGAPELILLSGLPGAGKSALVNALRRDLKKVPGLFASGKFDEQKKNIPYASLAQAFQHLIRQLLVQTESEIATFRRVLEAAVYPNGRVLTDVLPDLELLLGPQQGVAEVAPREAKIRFFKTFNQFLDVLATREHPLILFLDDLQWLDPATLELLVQLITQAERRHLLLLGAYRDSEVNAAHPFRTTLESLREAGVPTHDIVLGPLAGDALAALLADMLHSAPERVEPLAQLVYEKTAGNPFFTLQFLAALHDERLLWFAPDKGGWTFDLSRIRAKGHTDNVVDLLAGRLHRLTAPCQKILQVLACLGIRAEKQVLTRLLGDAELVVDAPNGPASGIYGILAEAERAGLLLELESGYAFVHDRIRETAYASIAPSERPGEHLRIGRLLLAHRTAEEVEDGELFELLNQFNRGLALLTDPRERDLIRRLNLRAGRKSKAAIAYAAAREYLAHASLLLAQDAWTTNYVEAFATGFESAECEYLVGRFAQAEERFQEIFEKARTAFDRAKALSLRGRIYETSGRYGEALESGLAALALLGVAAPDSAHIQQATEAVRAQIPVLQGGRRIADLALAEEVSDPQVRASLDLLGDTFSAAYMGKPELFPWLVFQGVTLSLKHGNTASSCFAYSSHAVLLVGYRDIGSALAFSDLALALSERFHDATWKAGLLCGHGLVSAWGRPLTAGKSILERAIDLSLEAGDYPFVLYSSSLAIWFDVESAESVAVARSNCARYRAFADRFHNDVYSYTFRLCDQFFRKLQGQPWDPSSSVDGVVQDEAALEAYSGAGDDMGRSYYCVLSLAAAFSFGKFAQALEHAEQAWAVQGQRPLILLQNASHVFFHALTLTALYPQVPPERQAEFAQKQAELLAHLKYWADNCPETFRSRHALVAAEIFRVQGHELDAMKAYAQAIDSARENGFLFLESLACELAARFYRDHDFGKNADAHLRDARAGYLRWGADAKVAQLDRLYPGIEKPVAPGPTTTFGASLGELDLANVVKASQAVSEEIELEKLVEKLMGLVMDHAGADRGLLLLPAEGGDRFVVEAEAGLGRQGLVIRQPRTALDPAQLAEGVFRYVLRTREQVILEDASSQGLFTEDAYVREKKSKSILGLPLLKQARLLGVLYLENNLAPGVFTHSRITALEVLASQAAISLENARLFAELEQERCRLRTVIQQMPAGLIIAEAPSGRFLIKNDQVDRMLNFAYHPAGSIEGYSLYTGFHRDGRRLAPEDWPLARSIRTGETVTEEEVEMLWADGSKAWLSLSSTPIRDPSGTITSGVVVFQDVTERKRRDEALRASEERFSKAFKSNPTPMAVIRSKDSTFVDANDRFLRLLGYTAEEIYGREAAQLGPWFVRLLRDAGRRLATGAPFRDEELSASAQSGEPKALLASVETTVLGGDTCYLATFVDLTDRKRVEEQLRQSQKMEAIGSLAGGVAHDFNNLLTAINGYSELAMMGMPETSKEYDHLLVVRSAGERAAGLTRQLLAFSRKETLQTRVQSLNAIVAEMEGMLRRLIEENIEIETRLDPDVASVNVDKGQVVQILMNLVVNARDAMPEGGQIVVQTRSVRLEKPTRDTLLEAAPGAFVALTIQDTGTGMTPEIKTKIFEPFFTTKQVGKGTGLGLAVVYGVVKQLGGGIDLQSEAGQGTTFSIYFPEAKEGTVTATSELAGREKPDSYRGAETILVVEDEDMVRRFVRRALIAQGYRVLESRNGVEALRLLEQADQPLDLIVTDLIMPDMGGRELAAQVRLRHPALPVLYTSGYSKEMGDSQELPANAEYFLSKPFGPIDLTRKVREILTPNGQ